VDLGCPDVAAAVGVCVFPDGLDLACLESIDCGSARDTNICPCCRSEVVYASLTWLAKDVKEGWRTVAAIVHHERVTAVCLFQRIGE
jgi:hypothetical protein